MPKSSSNDEPPHSSDLPNTLQTDETTSVAKLKEVVETFVAQRNWHQFHSPKNLSMSLSIEAAEL
ncbi:MAG: hypothetical protein MPJ24_09815, partial [Pirellulaceae bacterium]|nr:hypothetical protein [Pirellulaceae bacterium]